MQQHYEVDTSSFWFSFLPSKYLFTIYYNLTTLNGISNWWQSKDTQGPCFHGTKARMGWWGQKTIRRIYFDTLSLCHVSPLLLKISTHL